jgi:3-isopropylmalate/(R)-2-methylmalate dehydratase small subunit
MKPFRRETGTVAPLLSGLDEPATMLTADGARAAPPPVLRSNVDTDQIIPKQFLKRIERTGFGGALFFDWRFHAGGGERDGFVLNREPFRRATVLLAGRNFGCGSSREHAVWALQDFGFRAVIAPSFADIFSGNAAKAGLLTVALPEPACAAIAGAVAARPGVAATVDLEACEVAVEAGTWAFEVDPFARHCLLEGLDDIGLTLRHEAAIAAYEAARPRWLPDSRRRLGTTHRGESLAAP